MLDIPVEMLFLISTHLTDLNLQLLVATLQSICRSLLLKYLCRCGLVLKNTSMGGLNVELCNLSGYASLRL
jgi:hypothetical protein